MRRWRRRAGAFRISIPVLRGLDSSEQPHAAADMVRGLHQPQILSIRIFLPACPERPQEHIDIPPLTLTIHNHTSPAMSSLRNAVNRRVHRERAQPKERERFGILEKAKVRASPTRRLPTASTSLGFLLPPAGDMSLMLDCPAGPETPRGRPQPQEAHPQGSPREGRRPERR